MGRVRKILADGAAMLAILLGFGLVGVSLIASSLQYWLGIDSSADRWITSLGSGGFVASFIFPLIGVFCLGVGPGALYDGNFKNRMPHGMPAVIVWVGYCGIVGATVAYAVAHEPVLFLILGPIALVGLFVVSGVADKGA